MDWVGIGTFIGVMGTIIVGLYSIYLTENKLREKDSEIAKLKEEYIKEFPKRNLEEIRRLISNAKESVDIIGVVGYLPVHESYSEITRHINNGMRVRILIMNPNSYAWKEVEKNELDSIQRLKNEHDAVMRELKGIYGQLQPECKHLLKVKLIDIEPEASIQIVDAEKMYVNTRPPKAELGRRGYEEPMFLVTKNILAHRKTFEYYSNQFNSTFDNTNVSHQVNLE